MNLTVVRESCKGHGACIETAPHIFELDDSGVAVVQDREIADDDSRLARKAMFLCPEGTIVIATAP